MCEVTKFARRSWVGGVTFRAAVMALASSRRGSARPLKATYHLFRPTICYSGNCLQALPDVGDPVSMFTPINVPQRHLVLTGMVACCEPCCCKLVALNLHQVVI